ncbi:ribosomal RNA small subunit methyltransferase H, partial [Chytriomyces sp. MP71]
MAAPAFSHSPVLLRQVLQHLAPPAALAAAGASAVTAPGGRTARRLAPALDASKYTFMDATFGGGGYTRAILEKFPNSKVIAIDQDPAAMEQAKQLAEQFKGRFIPLRGKFGSMTKLLESELGMIGPCLDGVVFDIGVSSYQLDNAYRGFSFRNEGPLDMRMCADTLVGPQFDELANSSLTADHIVNTFAESELADIIFEYGDERKSRRIARAIVQARDVNPIKTTRELSELVVKSAGKNYGAIHPATRT